MGNEHSQQVLANQVKNAKGQLDQMFKQLQMRLNSWASETKKQTQEFTKYSVQKEMSKDYGSSLENVQKCLQDILQIKADPTNSAQIVANILVNTVKNLTKSVSAKSKEKSGYYLIAKSYGVVKIHYYFYCRQIEAKYLFCKQTQTLIAYGYAVGPYKEKYDLKKLGSLVAGMDLDDSQQKQVLKGLAKFATDADKMAEMKQYAKEAQDFW